MKLIRYILPLIIVLISLQYCMAQLKNVVISPVYCCINSNSALIVADVNTTINESSYISPSIYILRSDSHVCEESGIDNILEANDNKTIKAIYSIDGRLVNNETKGFVIVIYTDNTIEKQIIK